MGCLLEGRMKSELKCNSEHKYYEIRTDKVINYSLIEEVVKILEGFWKNSMILIAGVFEKIEELIETNVLEMIGSTERSCLNARNMNLKKNSIF
jgi:hypothetical protein